MGIKTSTLNVITRQTDKQTYILINNKEYPIASIKITRNKLVMIPEME